ncbi:MAG TPA: hypothetical protein VI454_16435 [Verrucomicrobiae bacterium]|jgi:hypothetical protein
MKNKKPTPKRARQQGRTTAAEAQQKLRVKREPLAKSFVSELEARLPSSIELAKLAATLARDLNFDKAGANIIAGKALGLWQACHVRREELIQKARVDAAKAISLLEAIGPFPWPRSWPISHDEFLRLTVGGRSKHSRERFFEDFVRDRLHVKAAEQSKPAPCKEAVNGVVAVFRRRRLSKEQYIEVAVPFVEWLKTQPSKRAKRAAGARWNRNKNHENRS